MTAWDNAVLAAVVVAVVTGCMAVGALLALVAVVREEGRR